MADTFSTLGKTEAIDQLYRLSAYHPVNGLSYVSPKGGRVSTAARLYLEGMDFNLVYFPLKHLGYKCVVGVVGELYAALARPKLLNVVLGVSAKLDFPQIQELWMGITVAAKEHGFEAVHVDLQPSANGLWVSMAATGETSLLTDKRRRAAASKDLLCVSGRLGAAYLGLQLLEKGARDFASTGQQPDMGQYRMLVGACLRPELSAGVVEQLEDAEIYPSYGYFLTHGLSDALLQLSRDSGLGVKVYADKIPFEGNSFALGKQLDVDPISAAMNGGDDNQLLFVVPILQLEKFRKEFPAFDVIGHLARPEVGTVLVTPEGVEFPVTTMNQTNTDYETHS